MQFLIFISTCLIVSLNAQPAYVRADCNPCAGGYPGAGGGAGMMGMEATTKSSEPTTTDYFQKFWVSQGWEADDGGNVFIGDDNAKLSLIQIGSYCPPAICKGWFGGYW